MVRGLRFRAEWRFKVSAAVNIKESSLLECADGRPPSLRAPSRIGMRLLPLIELFLDIPASSVRPGFNGCNTDIQSLRCFLGGVLMNKTQFKYGAAAGRQ